MPPSPATHRDPPPLIHPQPPIRPVLALTKPAKANIKVVLLPRTWHRTLWPAAHSAAQSRIADAARPLAAALPRYDESRNQSLDRRKTSDRAEASDPGVGDVSAASQATLGKRPRGTHSSASSTLSRASTASLLSRSEKPWNPPGWQHRKLQANPPVVDRTAALKQWKTVQEGLYQNRMQAEQELRMSMMIEAEKDVGKGVGGWRSGEGGRW